MDSLEKYRQIFPHLPHPEQIQWVVELWDNGQVYGWVVWLDAPLIGLYDIYVST